MVAASPERVKRSEDPLQGGGAGLLPERARLVMVPDEDHVGAFRRSDLLLPELGAFLALARSTSESPAG